MMDKKVLFPTEERQRVLTPYTPSLVQPLALLLRMEKEDRPLISLVRKNLQSSPLNPAFSPPYQSVRRLYSHQLNKVEVSHLLLMGTVAVASPSLQATPTHGHAHSSQRTNPITPYLEVFKTAYILRWRKIEGGWRNSLKHSKAPAYWIVLRLA